jgi:hypothetical protein
MVNDIKDLDFSKQYTYADYLTWTFKERVELIKGWIHKMSPAPLDKHQRIASSLYLELETTSKGGVVRYGLHPMMLGYLIEKNLLKIPKFSQLCIPIFPLSVTLQKLT